MAIVKTVKSKYHEIQRELREQRELELAKSEQHERQKTFEEREKIKRTLREEEVKRQKLERQEMERALKGAQKIQHSRQKEEQARSRAERDRMIAEQKASEKETEAQQREARRERAQASAELRKEKLHSVVSSVTSHPMFKPVELTGTALRGIARGGITKFYILGRRPSQHSPSYEALVDAFGGQPFTAEQAVRVVSVRLQTSEPDAYNRLHLMKGYGFIKEGV